MEAGPPVFAPLLASLVGGMGLLAAVLRREGRAATADHLPKRSDGSCAVPQPRPARRHPAGPGRFPGFDVLDRSTMWDDVTAGVVLARLALPGALAFFTPDEAASPGRCWICCSPRTPNRGCRSWR